MTGMADDPGIDSGLISLDLIPLGIFILGEDYRVVFWNRCLADWTGRSAAEMEGLDVREVYPRLGESRFASRLNQVFEMGAAAIFSSQIHKYVIPVPGSDGEPRLQHTTVTAYPSGKEGVHHALFSIQDVTDISNLSDKYRRARNKALAEAELRKRTADQLQDALAKLSQAQKLARVGQWELDLGGGRAEWSPGVYEILELDPERFPASHLTFLAAVHPDDREAVNRAYSETLVTRRPQSVYHRLVMADGRIKHVRQICQLEYDLQDRPIRSLGVIQDITDLRSIEDKLRESEERHRLLFETANDAILVHDTKRVLDFNYKSIELFGANGREDLLNRPIGELSAGPAAGEADDSVGPSARWALTLDGQAQRFEWLCRRLDGQTFEADISLNRLDLNGRPCVMAIIRDVSEAKRNERALARSEALHREAQQIASIGHFERDLIADRDVWSEQTYLIFGYRPGRVEVNLDLFNSIIHPEDKERVGREMTEAETTGRFSFETRIIRPDDKLRWIYSQGKIEKDSDGTPLRAVGTIRDVTRRKEYEAALIKAREVEAVFASLARDLVSSNDIPEIAAKILEAGRRLLDSPDGFVGYVDDQTGRFEIPIMSEPAATNCAVENKDDLVRIMIGLSEVNQEGGRAVMSNGGPEGERSSGAPKGHIPIRRFILNPALIDGQVVGLTAFANAERDYTAFDLVNARRLSALFTSLIMRRRYEVQLRQSEDNFRALVEGSPAAILVTDPLGTIEYVNPSFTAVTGYSSEEVIGANPRIMKSGLHDAEFYRGLWRVIRRGEIWRGEICNRKKDGSLFWEQVSVSPLVDREGKIIKFVAVKEDISDKKDLERLKSDVDRIMRHDLKTPLNGIIGLPQLLLMDDNLTDQQRELLESVEISGRRMLRMIDMSLDLFKMETGSYEYEPERIDALEIIEGIVKDSEFGLAAKKIKAVLLVNGGTPTGPFHIDSDGELFYTLCANLITNAAEASPEGEELVVDFRSNGVRSIAFRNRGAVPMAIRAQFFGKYKTHGKRGGTGLGTYSARLIAEAMGYKLTMQTSDREDATVITITLPPN